MGQPILAAGGSGEAALGEERHYRLRAGALAFHRVARGRIVRCDIIRIPSGKHGTGGWHTIQGVRDWERQTVEWLNARLNHEGPIGEGIRPRTAAATRQ